MRTESRWLSRPPAPELVACLTLLCVLPLQAQQTLPEPSQTQHDHGGSGTTTGMSSMLGPYAASREGGGTAWQPESSPIEGLMLVDKKWQVMFDGFVNLVGYEGSGPRGESDAFSTNMFMFMGQRKFGKSTFGFRAMSSLEPSMGAEGYPLLLQTGETADGVTPLIDRQHPHDLLMELAAVYSLQVGDEGSFFAYVAPVGMPALGPVPFQMRASGGINPLAPISHHWLDSQHVSYGVVTLGFSQGKLKLEGSVFRGAEPDEDHWDLESPEFDSYSGRITFNPTADLSFQLSFGHLEEPEQVHPGLDIVRSTFSGTYNRPLRRGNWQTTLAAGVNRREFKVLPEPRPVSGVPPTLGAPTTLWSSTAVPSQVPPTQQSLSPRHFLPPTLPGDEPVVLDSATQSLSAFLLESTASFGAHSVFVRAELAEKDELFPLDDPRVLEVYDVSQLNLGYVYDFLRLDSLHIGVGAAGIVSFLPSELEEEYGSTTPTQGYLYLRFKTK